MLSLLKDGSVYRRLEELAARLREGIEKNIENTGAGACYPSIASLGCLYFRDRVPHNWQQAAETDSARFAVYFREMLRRGIYLAPSAYEAGFLCAAHTEQQIDRIIQANGEALAATCEVAR
jgi:glutamate-1-semialdehyde 2,1-aminomutase